MYKYRISDTIFNMNQFENKFDISQNFIFKIILLCLYIIKNTKEHLTPYFYLISRPKPDFKQSLNYYLYFNILL